MKVKFIYVVLFIVSPIVFAKNTSPLCLDGLTDAANAAIQPLANVVDRLPGSECVSEVKIKLLCFALSSQETEQDPNSPYSYKYERIMSELSCVKVTDSPEVIRKKIQTTWEKNKDIFNCDQPDFNIPGGNFLKYSVNRRSFNFIDAAIEDWSLNLNTVDKIDNKTVLDYVQSELDKSRGSNNESALKNYLSKLKRAGAKYRSEL